MKRIIEILVLLLICGVVYWLCSPRMSEVEAYKTKTVTLNESQDETETKQDKGVRLLENDVMGKDRQVGWVNLEMFKRLVAERQGKVKIEVSGNKAIVRAYSANDLFGNDGKDWVQYRDLPIEISADGREFIADVESVDSTDIDYIKIPYQVLSVIARDVRQK